MEDFKDMATQRQYGDAYIKEILDTNPELVSATEEWKETYNEV